MATVEVLAPSGFTLTLRLYALGSDTEAVNVAMTEATNRKGTYTATVNGQSGNFSVTVDAAGSLIGNGYLWLQDDAGTYRTTAEADFLATGEPGQEAPPVNAKPFNKLAFLYKTFRNRIVTSTTLLEIFNDNGTVVDQKASISDSAGATTRQEMQSGP